MSNFWLDKKKENKEKEKALINYLKLQILAQNPQILGVPVPGQRNVSDTKVEWIVDFTPTTLHLMEDANYIISNDRKTFYPYGQSLRDLFAAEDADCIISDPLTIVEICYAGCPEFKS